MDKLGRPLAGGIMFASATPVVYGMFVRARCTATEGGRAGAPSVSGGELGTRWGGQP